VNDGLHAPVLYRDRSEGRERARGSAGREREREREEEKVREDGESGVCNGEKQEQKSGKS